MIRDWRGVGQEQNEGRSDPQGQPRRLTVEERYRDLSEGDEFDLITLTYRGEIAELDAQIKDLDRSIEREKSRIAQYAANLEACVQARSRLLFLRTANVHFLMQLARHPEDHTSLSFEALQVLSDAAQSQKG